MTFKQLTQIFMILVMLFLVIFTYRFLFEEFDPEQYKLEEKNE